MQNNITHFFLKKICFENNLFQSLDLRLILSLIFGKKIIRGQIILYNKLLLSLILDIISKSLILYLLLIFNEKSFLDTKSIVLIFCLILKSCENKLIVRLSFNDVFFTLNNSLELKNDHFCFNEVFLTQLVFHLKKD